VGQICSLPLSPLGHPDQMVWSGNKSGLFTVKSAYYLEMQHRNQAKGESSTAWQEVGMWKSIWNLNVPPVLKNFLWKVCHNVLPTKVNLFSKKIVQDPLCPCCSREEESLFHILWNCPSSMAFWQECARKIQKMAIDLTDGWGLIHNFMERLDGEDLLLALTIARHIWLRRNTFVFENIFLPPLQVLNGAKTLIAAFEEAINPMVVERNLVDPSQVRWKKPPPWVMKLNWDAILNVEKKATGIGVIIRDEGGDFVAALTKFIPYIVDPLIAESVAVWFAAQFICELGLQHMILEGDSLSVISDLKKIGPCGSGCGQLISDTKLILSSLLHCDFHHMKRDANKVAHCMSKFALSQMLDKTWIEVCPSFI
jgi:hypothetical protein